MSWKERVSGLCMHSLGVHVTACNTYMYMYIVYVHVYFTHLRGFVVALYSDLPCCEKKKQCRRPGYKASLVLKSHLKSCNDAPR